jgi:hypothetical protein
VGSDPLDKVKKADAIIRAEKKRAKDTDRS